MMKPTLQNVKRLAAKYGATVTKGGDRFVTVDVDLPPFKVWRATGGHCLSAGGYHSIDADGYADLIERMEKYGAEDCPDCDCDICKDERGEP